MVAKGDVSICCKIPKKSLLFHILAIFGPNIGQKMALLVMFDLPNFGYHSGRYMLCFKNNYHVTT